jgi:hypothetical protein
MTLTATPWDSIAGPNKEPHSSLMTITPEMAQNWLDNSNNHNRPLSMAYCERLARDMREGNWKTTHEGIAFSSHGRLLDGQHRLTAITLAKVSVTMFVWFDVPPESLMAINNGRPRNLVDLLSLSGAVGGIDFNDVAILRAMLGGMGRAPTLTPAEAAAAYHRHKDAIEFATVYLPRRNGITSVATSDIRAVIARAYYSVDLDRLAAFCQVLCCGLATSPSDRPAVLLFAHLVRNPGTTEMARHDRYARAQRALAAYLRGEDLGRLAPVSNELFPLPEEK